MRGIVFGKTFEQAEKQLQKIIEDYKKIGIEPASIYHIRKSKWDFSVEFPNGDYWKAVGAATNARGMACNIAYIDQNIDDETIACIIMPTIKSFPYQAYRYY